MEIKQCWTSYQQAENLLKHGHWAQARFLFEDVLHYLPEHIQNAAQNTTTKPCQMACLISVMRDAAIKQAEILTSMGHPQRAFAVLNNCYALLQFTSIEESDLIQSVASVLDQSSELLLNQMTQLCLSQRQASWQLEHEHLTKSHHYFTQLKAYRERMSSAVMIN